MPSSSIPVTCKQQGWDTCTSFSIDLSVRRTATVQNLKWSTSTCLHDGIYIIRPLPCNLLLLWAMWYYRQQNGPKQTIGLAYATRKAKPCQKLGIWRLSPAQNGLLPPSSVKGKGVRLARQSHVISSLLKSSFFQRGWATLSQILFSSYLCQKLG